MSDQQQYPQYGPSVYYPPQAPPPAPPRKSRRWIGWTVAALALVAITGAVVGGNSHPAGSPTTHAARPPIASASHAPTVEAPAPVDVPAQSNVDLAFVTVVRGAVPTLAGADDSTLIGLGHSACDALDAGNSFEEVAMVTMTAGQMSGYEAGSFIGASIGAYCPEDAVLVPGLN